MDKITRRCAAGAFALTLIACGHTEPRLPIRIAGAGATLPAPLYERYFLEYNRETGVTVNYQAVGSGAGQARIFAQTVDFAGSDAFLTDAQLADAPGDILHIPAAIGGVVPVYNLPGLTARLRFDGELLADIFLGNVRSWSDAPIVQANPGVALPNLPITVVRRADGSGTTAIFVDYLSKVSSEFAQRLGRGPQTSVNWPGGVGGQGSAGVASLVRQTPGGLGYLENAYAQRNGLTYGTVRNAAGAYVDGGDLAALAAAAAVTPVPADTRASLTNAGGEAYPVAGFTWLLAYREQKYGNRDHTQGRGLADLLYWVTHDGQRYNENLGYAALPSPVVAQAEVLVSSMTYGGGALR